MPIVYRPGQEFFSELTALLKRIRNRAAARRDNETSGDADRADVLLRDFAAAVGEQIRRQQVLLLISYKASERAVAVLQTHHEWQKDWDATVEAIVGLEGSMKNWLESTPDSVDEPPTQDLQAK
ncbi:MAG: hypothetical protein ABSF12_18480 [Bryobacteraceae bacterium]|jgi:hypothetical protein